MNGGLSSFLTSEYAQAGKSVVHISVCGRNYIVPYAYVQEYEKYQNAFLNDFFQHQKKELEQYQKFGLKYKTVKWKNHRQFIVPFNLRNQSLSASQIAEKILKHAERTYCKAVRIACKLAEIYPERKFKTFINVENINAMQKAYYEFQIKSARSHAVYITKRVNAFLAAGAVKATDNIKSYSLSRLASKAGSWALRLVLSATVSEAVLEAVKKS